MGIEGGGRAGPGRAEYGAVGDRVLQCVLKQWRSNEVEYGAR
jgi:hypothetical protein